MPTERAIADSTCSPLRNTFLGIPSAWQHSPMQWQAQYHRPRLATWGAKRRLRPCVKKDEIIASNGLSAHGYLHNVIHYNFNLENNLDYNH